MKLVEFEQRALSDPWDPELDAMVTTLADNAADKAVAILADARELDRQLAQAMDVDVPDGLAQRILAQVRSTELADEQIGGQHTVAGAAGGPSKTRAPLTAPDEAGVLERNPAEKGNVVKGPWFARAFQQPAAIAASLVLTLAAGLFVGYKLQSFDAPKDFQVAASEQELRQAIGSHILEEQNKLAWRDAVNPGLVKATFADFGGQIDRLPTDAGVIVYVSNCPMRDGRRGVHLIALDSHGNPVTVFYMDKEMIPARRALNVDGFKGELVPDRRGSWAMLGKDKQSGEQILDRLRRSVKWSI